MQLAAFSARIAVSPERIREWVRSGVVLPSGVLGGRGRGHPNDFDEPNLLTGTIAEMLSRMHVVVAHYRPAFVDLDEKLRAHPSFEWGRFQLEITPNSADLRETGEGFGAAIASIRLDLMPICTSLMLSDQQQSLAFGLQAVR